MRACALGQLDRQLGLEAEVVRDDRNRLQEVRADRLVARLHVGEVQVRDEVGEQRQQPVAELVTKQQHAADVAAGEPRAEHRVGVLVENTRDDAQQILRVVLEVGVVDDRDRRTSRARARCGSRALALVPLVAQEHATSMPSGCALRSASNARSTSGVPSVEQSSTTMTSTRSSAGSTPESATASSEVRDEMLLVVDGNEHRQGCARRRPGRVQSVRSIPDEKRMGGPAKVRPLKHPSVWLLGADREGDAEREAHARLRVTVGLHDGNVELEAEVDLVVELHVDAAARRERERRTLSHPSQLKFVTPMPTWKNGVNCELPVWANRGPTRTRAHAHRRWYATRSRRRCQCSSCQTT